MAPILYTISVLFFNMGEENNTSLCFPQVEQEENRYCGLECFERMIIL